MSLTPGSWWVNRRTRQKLAVADPRALLTETEYEYPPTGGRGRRKVSHGLGRPADRYPCRLQGQYLYLAWLTEDELHGGWQRLSLKPDNGVIPSWLRSPKHNDFLLYGKPVAEARAAKLEPVWVSLMGLRSGWLCLSGMVEDEATCRYHDVQSKNATKERVPTGFNWGLQRYNTFFLPASEAVPRLLPKYERIRTTVYDYIAQGGAIDDDSV